MKYIPEISVITSAYNRGKFLKKLMNSLSNQTFKNFEWILGNDGSSDNTDQIINNEACWPLTCNMNLPVRL